MRETHSRLETVANQMLISQSKNVESEDDDEDAEMSESQAQSKNLLKRDAVDVKKTDEDQKVSRSWTIKENESSSDEEESDSSEGSLILINPPLSKC